MPDTRRLDDVLARCAAGVMPARIAAMHVLMEVDSSEAAQEAVLRVREASDAASAGHLHDLESLMRAADRGDLERLAQAQGLSLVGVVERPCASWDAPVFHLIKRDCRPGRRQ